MTYDKTHTQNKPPPLKLDENLTLDQLNDYLEATQANPEQTRDILDEQTQILDRIFTTIMNEKVASRLSDCDRFPDRTMQWIALALKVQKNCMTTTKAKAAIDYMNAITPTPSLKIEKQTSEIE